VRDLRLAAWVVIAVAVAGGLVEFGHAFEPGSAEASGITLNGLVDTQQGAVSSDWSTAGSRASVRAVPGGFALRASNAHIDLMSRSLPVFAHDCYRLLVRAEPRRPVALRIRDELGTRVLGTFRLAAAGAPHSYAFPFGTAGHERIALTIEAPAGAVVDLFRVQVQRDGAARSCPPLS
jgi:hypothetical protein